ncbi:hypothetical protein RHMOL_Rhmol01G0274700 [Rhododendron molle]|uniref:Uncharacterized protein n=1 Tax=Rhododendron molle TaxID=49168 RepID=A0ACC0Q8T5_RHOML|nr:hypothetical protein RHMOL_Rhmol01G0274700 [Rhododendron molle]
MAGLFKVEVHHLGRFVENPVRYVEGVVNHVDDCDIDLWSKLEVEDIVERLGYPKYKMLRYRIPELGLEEGLRVVGTDKDAISMVEVVKGHEQIEIYVEHVIDELDADANVMHFPALPPPEMPEGVEIHIDEEVVNGENVYYNSDIDERLRSDYESEELISGESSNESEDEETTEMNETMRLSRFETFKPLERAENLRFINGDVV